MAAIKWMALPGGRLKRWKKSRGDAEARPYVHQREAAWYW